MTELQMGLIGLGAAAVIGVLGYNKWQEIRHRKLAEKLLNSRHSDVLFDEGAPARDTTTVTSDADAERRPPTFSPEAKERIEPVWRPAPETATDKEEDTLPEYIAKPAELAFDTDAVAPDNVSAEMSEIEITPLPERVSERAPDALAAASIAAPEVKSATANIPNVAEPLHLLSPVIDYVASFEAVEPAPAYQILETRRQLQARIRKPVMWVGYNEYAREWERIAEGGSASPSGQGEYRRLRVGLQLVDRHGPVSDSDLSIFHIAMQDLADELMAITDLPARQPTLDTAVKLDAFCAGVDIQIGINVISQNQVFQGTKLRALAEAAGLSIDSEGRFVRHDEDGNVLFLLQNQEAAGFSADTMKSMTTHGLTFLLDVPRVAHGERVFNQMVELARRFADVLHGVLVDDNRRPLSESALEPIRQQIVEFQSVMAAQNFPAGSPLTQRLFS